MPVTLGGGGGFKKELLCTYHNHLYFSPCCSVFINNIIEENDFCELHGQIIFIAISDREKN